MPLFGQSLQERLAADARAVIHRDIKPANIRLDGDRAVVADVGIAKAICDACSPDCTLPGRSRVTGRARSNDDPVATVLRTRLPTRARGPDGVGAGRA